MGDKADHCCFHSNPIPMVFKFWWYHLPSGEPISAATIFIIFSVCFQYASDVFWCDKKHASNGLSTAFQCGSLISLAFPGYGSHRVLNFEIWGRKNTGTTWNGHCFSSRHPSSIDTRIQTPTMDRDVWDVQPQSYQGRGPRKPEESCDLRWSQMISDDWYILVPNVPPFTYHQVIATKLWYLPRSAHRGFQSHVAGGPSDYGHLTDDEL